MNPADTIALVAALLATRKGQTLEASILAAEWLYETVRNRDWDRERDAKVRPIQEPAL